jgi:hypothetical protein
MFRKLPATISALATTRLFRDLSKRELQTVQRVGTVVDLDPGRPVRCPRSHSGQFAVIVWGEVVATNEAGRRRALGPGDWFGTIADDEPETFETQAHTTLFVMSRREYLGLRSVCPRVAARLSGLFDETHEIHVVHGPLTGSLAR